MIVENIEYDVINEKNKYDENIYVSVYCSTFNHVNYIAESLDNILAQKCKYKYQIVVIDDCSNDGTTEILRKYCKAYPSKICGIIARKNTYNNPMRWSIYKKIIKDFCIGKYIAMCETDDYWCDANKLFKQINYLELHPECVMSLHNGLLKNCKTGNVSVMNSMDKEGDISVEDIITQKYGNWPTASMVLKRNLYFLQGIFSNLGIGDWPLRMNAVLKGKIHYFPELMSVYRYMVPGSWTARTYTENPLKLIYHRLRMINFLLNYDLLTQRKYSAAIYVRMHDCLPKIVELQKDDYNEMMKNEMFKLDNANLREAYDIYISCMKYYFDELKMKKLKGFATKFDHVYIYGAGEYAQLLANILEEHGIKIDGYVVSSNKNIGSSDRKILCFCDAKEYNAGFIVGMSTINMLKIRENLQHISPDRIYYFFFYANILSRLTKKQIKTLLNVQMNNSNCIKINERNISVFTDG